MYVMNETVPYGISSGIWFCQFVRSSLLHKPIFSEHDFWKSDVMRRLKNEIPELIPLGKILTFTLLDRNENVVIWVSVM